MVVHCMCVIIVTIYLTILIWGISAQDSGKYEAVLETLEDCASKGSGEISVTATARTDENGKIVHTGDLKLPFGLTDKLKAEGNAYKMVDGEWRPIGLIYKMAFQKACSNMKSRAPIWFQIMKSSNVENHECAISKGTYHFVDYRIKGKIAKQDSLPYGKYRVRLNFLKNDKKIGCMCYIVNIIPLPE